MVTFRSPLVAAALLVATTTAAAKTDEPSLRALLETTELSSVAISPDGRLVAFREHRASIDDNRHILTWWVAPVDGGAPARAIADAGEGAWLNGSLESEPPIWTADSKAILFRALREAEVQIWSASADGAAVRQITREPGNVQAIAAAPDRRSILFTENAPRDDVVRAEQTEYESGTLVDASVDPNRPLYRGGWINGRWATERLTGEWYGHGGLLADRTVGPLSVDVVTGSVGAASARDAAIVDPPIATMEHLGTDLASGRADSGDRRGKAYAIWRVGNDELRVYRTPGSAPIVCQAAECRHSTIKWISWAGKSDSLIFSAGPRGFGTTLFRWTLGDGQVRKIISSSAQLSGYSIYNAPCAIGDVTMVCVEADANHPPRLTAFSIANGASRDLVDPNPTLAPAALRFMPISWRDQAGRQFFGQLMLPIAHAKPIPLLINYYSCGGFLRGGLGEESPFRAFAQAGIAALCINRYPPSGAAPGGAVDDYKIAISGVSAVIKKLAAAQVVDPTRVGMAGTSFGGECAMWLAMHTRRLAAMAITNVLGTPTYYWFMALAGRTEPDDYKKEWGLGDPDKDRRGWSRISPAFNADKIQAPLLLQLPEQEYRPNIELVARLQRAHKPVELWAYPQEVHIKWQPRHQLSANERNLDWFRFWLQGWEDPAPEKKAQYQRWRHYRADQAIQLRAQRSESMIPNSSKKRGSSTFTGA